MTIDRLTCEQVFRRLDDFVDRELSPAERARVEEHLELCAMCAAEYRFEAHVIASVRERIQRIATPPDLLRRISEALTRTAPESGFPVRG